MDFSILISSMLSAITTIWYFIPIISLLIFFKTPFAKGLLGEFFVNFAINIRLDKKKYHLLKNVTIPTTDGTTQIDHIIVSEYGVFVIETKNMKGWIFGDEHQKTWTQKIYKHTNEFQNPLHQNYKHVKTLQSLLNINIDKIFSIVTFVGDSTFKTKMPKNITYGGGFISFINSKNRKLFSKEEVKEILLRIETRQLSKTRKTDREHIKHVKKIIEKKENTCPKCGSKLVLRVAKKGLNRGIPFYGCSVYPKCRYTKNK